MSGLELSPSFNGPISAPGAVPAPVSGIPAVSSSAPMMEGVRSGFNEASKMGGKLIDAVSGPAATPWMAGLGGIFSLVLAFKYGPGLVSNIPGLGGDGFVSSGMRGLVSLGLAVALGTGVFELVSNGFDFEKTGQTLKKDMGIVGDMIGNGAGWVDDTVTGGRVGETANLIGNNLEKMDDDSFNVVSGAGSLLGEAWDAQADYVVGQVDVVQNSTEYAGEKLLDGFDSMINHKPSSPNR